MKPERIELMTVSQVAGIFSVQPSTVYQWKRRGVLPGVLVGRTLRFRKSDVEALVRPKKGLTVSHEKAQSQNTNSLGKREAD